MPSSSSLGPLPTALSPLGGHRRLCVDPPEHAVKAGTMTHDYCATASTPCSPPSMYSKTRAWPLHSTPPAPGPRELPRHHRDGVPAGKMIHGISTTMAATGTPRCGAGSPVIPAWSSTSRRPRLVAERGRNLLFDAHPAPDQARQLPLDHRPAGRNPPLHRRAQRGSQADPRRAECSIGLE
jgi:hypothetical protein